MQDFFKTVQFDLCRKQSYQLYYSLEETPAALRLK